MKRKLPTYDFFALPFEIRSIIYTYLFQYEKKDRTDDTVYDPTPSFDVKSPLLRTSKVVPAEALPFLYRHHVFSIPVPRADIVARTPNVHESITKVQLMTSRTAVKFSHYKILWSCHYSPNALGQLHERFPNLRFLRIGLIAEIGFAVSTDLPCCKLLAQLWQRLSLLEIYVLYKSYYHRMETWEFRKAVAPDARWTLEAEGKAGKYWRTFRRAVWVAQRYDTLQRQGTRTGEVL